MDSGNPDLAPRLMKMLGLGLILLAVGWLAHRAPRPFRMRVQALQEWQRVLQRLMPLIDWQRRPLAEAFREAGQGATLIGQALEGLAQRLSEHDSQFEEALTEALQAMPWLWREDREALLALGRELGASSADYQAEHLRQAESELIRVLGTAREASRTDGRMLQAIIGAGGLALVILLL